MFCRTENLTGTRLSSGFRNKKNTGTSDETILYYNSPFITNGRLVLTYSFTLVFCDFKDNIVGCRHFGSFPTKFVFYFKFSKFLHRILEIHRADRTPLADSFLKFDPHTPKLSENLQQELSNYTLVTFLINFIFNGPVELKF